MIKFETKIDADTAKQINKFTFKKIAIPLIFVSLAFIILGVVGYLTGEDNIDRILAIIWLIFGFVFIPFVFGLALIFQKFLNKSAKYITNSTIEQYEFDENKMHLHQSSETFETDSKYDYRHFYKVFETNTHYFFYISRQLCHVIPKNSITEGTIEELNLILTQKLGAVFKQKK